jgi:signal peptidase I
LARRPAKSSPGEGGGTRRRRFETTRALFWAVLIALLIRSFLVEPFKIPSGSMVPTLLVGDYILVNKFSYGLRLPLTGRLLVPIGEPQRGDIVVFRYPDDPRTDYIKRVVGVSGDRIEVREGRVLVNGQPLDRIPDGIYAYADDQRGQVHEERRFREVNPDGVQYTVLEDAHMRLPSNGRVFVVPEGRYFMLGDNRDHSKDSRFWNNPYVSGEQLKGRAFLVHWSWDLAQCASGERGFVGDLLRTVYCVVTFQIQEIRWDRIGRRVAGLADAD